MKRRNENVSWGIAIEEFLQEKRNVGLTEKSIKDYSDLLNKYISDESITSFTEKTVKDFLYQHKHLTPQSINHYLRIFKAFGNFCWQNEYCERFKINLVMEREKPLKTYTEEEVGRLLEPPQKKDSYTTWRSYVMISLVCATGLRVGSLYDITTEDIDLKESTVSIKHLKNRKTVKLPLSSTFCKIFQQYIRYFEIEFYIFPCNDDSKLTYSAVKSSLKKYCESRGVAYRGIHGFRHFFSTQAIKNGMSVPLLQQFLTHSNLSTTERYLHISAVDCRNDELIPLDKLLKKK